MNLLILFFYIYPIIFIGLPLSTRILYALGGVFLFICQRFIDKRLFSVWWGLVPVALCSVGSGILNLTFDFTFVFYAFSQIAIFFVSHAMVYVFGRKKKNFDLSDFLKCFVYVVGIQSLLALLMFLFPALHDFMYSIIRLNELEDEMVDSTYGMRLQGWGSNFFGAGIINGLALILMTYLFLNKRVRRLWCFTILYVFILVIGILIARTTLIGFLFSLFYLLVWKWKNPYWIKRKMRWMLLVCLILLSGVSFIFLYLDAKVVMWAFEMFINYSSDAGLSSASTDRLKEMYVYPTSLKTYLIGDGLFNLKDHYYMETDVGYLRLLFYGGIPVALCFFIYPYMIIKKTLATYSSPLFKRLLFIIFLYVLVLNFKGLADVNLFLILLYGLLFHWVKNGQTVESDTYE